jgi:high-affinity Fe2+/Pb2+ permease
MFSFRLPLWVYWTLAGVAVALAAAFTIYYDFSDLEGWAARRLLFTVWGGPLTLVVAAALVTWLERASRR